MSRCPICNYRIDFITGEDTIHCPGCKNFLSLCSCCGVGFTVCLNLSEEVWVDESSCDEENEDFLVQCPYCTKEINLTCDDIFLRDTMIVNHHRIMWDGGVVYLFCSKFDQGYFQFCSLCKGIILFRKFDAEEIYRLKNEVIRDLKMKFKLNLEKTNTTSFLKFVDDSNKLIKKREALIQDYDWEIYSTKGLNQLSKINSKIFERVMLIEKCAKLYGFKILYHKRDDIVLSKLKNSYS